MYCYKLVWHQHKYWPVGQCPITECSISLALPIGQLYSLLVTVVKRSDGTLAFRWHEAYERKEYGPNCIAQKQYIMEIVVKHTIP